jgi:hypothetical protein
VVRRIAIWLAVLGCDGPASVTTGQPPSAEPPASVHSGPTVPATPVGSSHPPKPARICIPGPTQPGPSLLTRAQVARASNECDKALGRKAATALGASTDASLEEAVQRIAWFQRAVQASVPGLSVDGILDVNTRSAWARAFPSPAGEPEASLPPACWLRWPGSTPEQRAFMMRVYDVQRWRAAQKRQPASVVGGIAPIEDESTAQTDAAKACRGLLAAARAAKPAKGDLQVVFGYRSPETQLEIWEYHFPSRYRETAQQREALPGGEYGPEAVLLLATLYAGRTASPGYSLHNQGTAIDFACVTSKGTFVGPTGKYLSAWKGSWCFRWLERHARTFGFAQNRTIDEPWHWEFEGRP